MTSTSGRRVPTTLVMGASGNVGSAVVAALSEAGMPVRLAQRGPAHLDRLPAGSDAVRLDLFDADTWAPAFRGITAMFVLRPPVVGNVRRDLIPALVAARDAGVRQMVFLSLRGAETLKVVPACRRGDVVARFGTRLDVRPRSVLSPEPLDHPCQRHPRPRRDLRPGGPRRNRVRRRR